MLKIIQFAKKAREIVQLVHDISGAVLAGLEKITQKDINGDGKIGD